MMSCTCCFVLLLFSFFTLLCMLFVFATFVFLALNVHTHMTYPT